MNLLKLIKSGISGLYLSIKRFPYALSFSTLTTIVIIIIINIENSYDLVTIDVLERIAMTLALGFPLYLCLKVIFESGINVSGRNKIGSRLLSAVFLLSYYFILLNELDMVSISRYTAVTLALYLLFLVIPYFYKRNNFEIYVVKLFSRLSITLIYAVVLYSGLAITLFTINKLLNIPVTSELYVSTWLIVIGIFAPIFLLAGIPRQNEIIDIKEYPKLFEILLLYIVMPLITVYTSILYIYFVKILITRLWPEGLVAHLVLWYASISIIVLFFISPLRKNNWVSSFILWLPRALIPLLLMMFVAIGIRINNYGVTENRYFVVILGLWSIGIVLYYIFKRNRKNIILPLSLAILTILSVFGPWSSYSVSIQSQNKRFEEIVRKYDIIEDNTIVNNTEKLATDDREELNAILRYSYQYHQIDDIKSLPADFTTDDTEDYFGFTFKGNRYDFNKHQYFSYNLINNNRIIKLENYDYLFTIHGYNNEIKQLNNLLTVNLNDLNKKIIIMENDIEIYNRSLLPVLKEIHLKNKNIPYEKLNPEDFIFFDENKNLSIKIIFRTISGTSEISNPNAINIDNINLYLLIGLK